MKSSKDKNPDYTVMRVKQLLADKGWTMYKLAKETGVAYSTIVNPIRRNAPYSITMLEKVCMAFGITLAEFFSNRQEIEYTGLVLSPNENNLIELYRRLSKKDKILVIGYIQGLLAKYKEV